MKKTLFVGLFLFLVFSATRVGAMCLGAGPESYLVADKTTAIANGSDTITVTAHAGCNEASGWSYSNNDDLRLIISGADVAPAQQNNGRAAVNFTVTSTSPGSKNVQMQVYTAVEWGDPSKGDHWVDMGSPIVLNYTEETATPQTTASPALQSTSKPAATAPSKEVAPVAETPVAIATLSTINNADPSSGRLYSAGKAIILSGKAPANSIVRLYIYSELRMAETTADADGNWTYEVNGLEPGDHRVEAEVVDNAGKSSEKVEIATFSVVEPVQTKEDEQEPSQIYKNPYVIAAAAVIFVSIVAAGFLILRRKKSKLASLAETSKETQN